VCRGWVGLRADICACGFDLGTRNVERAIEQARRDLRTGRLLQLAGLGGIAVCAALFLMPPGLSIGWTMRTWFLVRGLPVITAIYGLGRGIGQRRDARRRLAVTEQMQRLPAARVVQRDRPASG
jgi:hypothetical protein